MNITIHSADPEADARAHEYVELRLAFALDRFENEIESVSVTLEDVNGPRGGVDKQCRIRVAMNGRRSPVVAEALQDVLMAAVDLAADRARRSVARILDKQSSRRVAPADPGLVDPGLSDEG